jgi:tetratricopeptide (TPR) repeat protein
MKTIFNHVLLLCSLFWVTACVNKKEISSLLTEAENLLENNPDSALFVLKNMNPEEMNLYNQAYYYLLLTEARDRNGESLLPSDSLLNYALGYLDDKHDKYLIAKAMHYKGKVWTELNELDEAVSWYQKAIDQFDETRYYDILPTIYIDLGKIYIDQSLYSEAMEMFHNAYLLSIKELDNKIISLSLRNMGCAYFFFNKPDSAHYFFQEALVYAKQDKDSIYLTNLIYNDLVLYYEETRNYETALQQLYNITEIKENTFLNVGTIFFYMQQYDSARHYLLLGTESNYIYTQAASYVFLEKLENLLGDYKKAYYYSDKYNEMRAIIESSEKTSEINNINHKYNIEAIVSKLEVQHKIKHGIILISSLFFLVILVCFFIVRDKKKKIKQQNQEKELLQKEKKLLQKEKELTTLKTEIKLIQGDITEYKQDKVELNNYQKLVLATKSDLIVLLKQITDIQSEKIRKTEIFSRIEYLSSQAKNNPPKILSYQEQDIMKKEISHIFDAFINSLRENCLLLTEEDTLFCCLSILKFSNLTLSLCFGSSDTNKIKQRKFRIKEKMTKETDNSFLFDFIFPALK